MISKFVTNLVEVAISTYSKLGKVKTIILVGIWIFTPAKIGMPILFIFLMYILYMSIRKSK